MNIENSIPNAEDLPKVSDLTAPNGWRCIYDFRNKGFKVFEYWIGDKRLVYLRDNGETAYNLSLKNTEEERK